VAPWITILSQRTLSTILSGLKIQFCVIFRQTRHHAQAYVTLGAFEDRGLSLASHEMNKDGSGVAWISLACVGYDGSQGAHYLLLPHLVFQPNWGLGRSWFFQLLQSNSSPEEVWNLGGYIEPHMKITESSCWVLLDPQGGKQFHELEVMSTHWIAVGHTIWNDDETHVLVVPFHDVRLHGAVAVITKIPSFWWWVHVSQHVNFSAVLPN